jgi:ABC-type lipoprotein export system ATPase subunit
MVQTDNKKTVFSISKNFVFEYKTSNENWKLKLTEDSLDESGNLNIKQGFVAILGESGSGKSTLMSVLSGFEKLSDDQKENISFYQGDEKKSFASQDLEKHRENSFGYIFQRCYESKPLSAIDNVALPLFIKQHSNKSVKYCEKLLESVNLDELANKSANELSGGQLTRIGILRGFAQRAEVLFADEPANNLDSQNADRILELLDNWVKKTNNTVIMVTHDLEHALKFADQIIILKSNGKEAGEIIFQKIRTEKEKKQEDKKQERQEIEDRLKIEETFKDFPEQPATNPPKKHHQYLWFLSKISLKNITSKADGSRTISTITLLAFISLFFIFFSGNQIVSWLTKTDELKNSTSFLRRFEIRVLEPHYLSEEIQNSISELSAGKVRKWIAQKINKGIEEITESSAKNRFLSPAQVLCKNQKYDQICDKNSANLINPEKWPINDNLISILQDYSRYLSDTIKSNLLNTDINIKKLKIAEKNMHDVIRLAEFLIDISQIDDFEKVATVYPRWDSAPQFIRKDGTPLNISTGIIWLDHQDPFFRDPRLKYLVNSDFEFESKDDQGIIIDKETLVDDLGYDLKANEVKIYYDNGEHACIPVRAIVERIPGGNYHALTTFGFGEKIRSSSQHCEDKKKFYQLHISLNPKIAAKYDFKTIWYKFNETGNKDEYGNFITDYSFVSDNTYEIYCDYKYAKTMSEWEIWIEKNLLSDKNGFELNFENTWEVLKEKEKEPPYRVGTVYAVSKNAVRALGEFLSGAYREDPRKNWKIEAYGYENKIKFAKQSETLLSSIKTIGIFLFLGLFVLFLSTNMLINVRNKATEIAIFRAMGGSVFSILYIFNLQVLMILIAAAFFAILIVSVLIPFARSIFITNIIHSIWKNIDEQREAITAISNGDILSIIAINQQVIVSSIVCVFVIVSIAVLYVRYSPKYAVSKILKER